MTLFSVLRKFRDLERRHLPFARSLVDYDLIIEIGYHEERGKPLTLKHLKTLGICTRTTLHRRLNSLVQEGVIVKSRADRDGRAVMLGVAKPAAQRLERFRHAIVTSVMHLF
jgi:DNA-binding MarR family transcriptional regulator